MPSDFAATAARPNAARTVHLRYIAPPAREFWNEVIVEESTPGSYFMVAGFRHGFSGLQELSDGTKAAIFSVWDPGVKQEVDEVPVPVRVDILEAGTGLTTERFDKQGTGMKGMMPYPWKLGVPYAFGLSAEIEGETSVYTARIRDAEGNETLLASYRALTASEPLQQIYAYVLDFRCDGASREERRVARFQNGAVETVSGLPFALTQAKLTADKSALTNIDGGVRDGAFFLASGGNIQQSAPLGTILSLKTLNV